jgi:hypothetical protein
MRYCLQSVRVLTIAATLAMVSPALANGSADEHRDCHGDAMRLCSHEIPNVDRITLCMEHHVKHLSQACRRHFGHGHHPNRY